MRRANQLTTAEIQKEQLFLVHLERELTNVLDKINENLNTLKVEELQIRSSAIHTNHKQCDAQENESTNKQDDTTFIDNPDVINRQELDLDIFLSQLEEEEEDN